MTYRILLIVDPQNDFCTGGALPVTDGEEIIPVVNKLLQSKEYDLRLASKDWHPANHKSFASQHPGAELFSEIVLKGLVQKLWTDHCIQNTPGAEFHPDLKAELIDKIFYKGEDVEVDSYSSFYDNARRHETGLREYIEGIARDNGITDFSEIEIDVCGLAFDICAGFTAIDAASCDFKVNMIYDACRSLSPEGEREMFDKLREAKVDVIESRSRLIPIERAQNLPPEREQGLSV